MKLPKYPTFWNAGPQVM